MSDATARACTRAILRMLGVLAYNVGCVATAQGCGMQFDPIAEADSLIKIEGIGDDTQPASTGAGGARPTFNHTRGDSELDPCPECAKLMTPAQLLKAVADLQDDSRARHRRWALGTTQDLRAVVAAQRMKISEQPANYATVFEFTKLLERFDELRDKLEAELD